jgi:hypothetical protein
MPGFPDKHNAGMNALVEMHKPASYREQAEEPASAGSS